MATYTRGEKVVRISWEPAVALSALSRPLFHLLLKGSHPLSSRLLAALLI
jgi:hypothetical protein